MQKEADEFSAIAVGCDHRAEQIRNVHAGQANALAAGQNRCEHDRAGKSPQQPTAPEFADEFAAYVAKTLPRSGDTGARPGVWVSQTRKPAAPPLAHCTVRGLP